MRFHCSNGLVVLIPVATGVFDVLSHPQTNFCAPNFKY